MSSYTPNINLLLTPESDTTTTFKEWRTGINGEDDNSNMAKIDKKFGEVSRQLNDLQSDGMLKSVYDTNNNGKVDDSDKLGGQPPEYYAAEYPVYQGIILSFSAESEKSYIDIPDAPNLIQNRIAKFAVDLVANYDLSVEATESLKYHVHLGFGEDPRVEPTQSEKVYKLDESGTTPMRVYDFAVERYRYIFEYSKRYDAYICINSIQLGNSGGSVMVIDNLNEDKPIRGHALSAHQGRVLKDMIDANSAGKRTCRFVVGTSTAGWTATDVDYLCDGVADDEEINAAIRALPSSGGEIVILDGMYQITNQINVYKDCILKGTGCENTVLCRNSDNASELISTTGSPNTIVFEHFSVDGKNNIYTNKYRGAISAVTSKADGMITIRNVKVLNSGYGVSLSSRCVVKDCVFANNLGSGIATNGNYFTIENNTCINNDIGIEVRNASGTLELKDDAVTSDGLSYTILNNNKCYSNRIGIDVKESYGVTITNNISNQNTDSGILISFTVDSEDGVIEYAVCLVSGNQCVQNGNHGICASRWISTDIENKYGVKPPLLMITSNFCSKNKYTEILLGDNIDMSICSDNLCFASQYNDAIVVYGENNLVANNVCNKNYVNNGATNNTFLNNKIC